VDVRWSVGLEATVDRILTHDEILALADAVAGSGGIATGIGTTHYGAQVVVTASTEDEAVRAASAVFVAAAHAAGLPAAPISRTTVEADG
jgi:hypothetical protein